MVEEEIRQLQTRWLVDMSEFELKAVRSRVKQRAQRHGLTLVEPSDLNFRGDQYQLKRLSDFSIVITDNILAIDDYLGWFGALLAH